MFLYKLKTYTINNKNPQTFLIHLFKIICSYKYNRNNIGRLDYNDEKIN